MKPSPFLKRIKANHDVDLEQARLFAIQFMQDMAVIANNRAFHAGPVATEKFLIALWDIMVEYADILHGDTKDCEYSQDQLDKALEKIMGYNFKPYKERYGGILNDYQNKHPRK